jgi:hypothetical protein
LVTFLRETGLEAEVYGTQMLNDCPQELWETLDADAITAEFGAVLTKLNGPRYWVLDGFGAKDAPMEPVMHDFNGILMRRIAVVKLGSDYTPGSYIERYVDRRAIFFFDAGRPVYELVDPTGKAYIMQALCTGVDPTISEENLPTLGERLSMPEGWSYRTRILEDELVIDTTDHVATVLQDEFGNSYTLPY